MILGENPLLWVSMSGIDPSLPGDVALYNPQSGKLLGMIPVGNQPELIIKNPLTKRIYVINKGSHTLSVIDYDNFISETTITVGNYPHALVIDQQQQLGYLANLGDQSLTLIDLEQKSVIETIPLAYLPLGLVLSQDGERLYLAAFERDQKKIILVTLDTVTKRVAGTFPLFHRSDSDYSDSDYSNRDCSNRDCQIDPSPNRTGICRLAEMPTALGLSLSVDGNLLYLPLPWENRVVLWDTQHEQVLSSIPAGQHPWQLALHPCKPLAYVANSGSHSISVLSTHEHQMLTTIPDLHNLRHLALTPDGAQLWVAHDYQLTIIDTITNAKVRELYAPPSAQTRNCLCFCESAYSSVQSETFNCTPPRPYSFATEKVYFREPKPFDLKLTVQSPTPVAKAEKIMFEEPQVKAPSISLLPIALRPNYYQLTFSFRLPYKLIYRDEQNQLQEYNDAIHHVLSGVEVHLTPGRITQNFNLKISTHPEVIKKSTPSPNSLELILRTRLVAIQQIHIIE